MFLQSIKYVTHLTEYISTSRPYLETINGHYTSICKPCLIKRRFHWIFFVWRDLYRKLLNGERWAGGKLKRTRLVRVERERFVCFGNELWENIKLWQARCDVAYLLRGSVNRNMSDLRNHDHVFIATEFIWVFCLSTSEASVKNVCKLLFFNHCGWLEKWRLC